MLHLEFNSDSENEGIARIVTAAYIMKFDPDMEEMDDIKTAVSEAVTNCIVHAYHGPDGKISMDISDQNGILRIEIKDQGIGISDVKKAMEPMFTTKPEEERTGNGIFFYGGIYGSSRSYSGSNKTIYGTILLSGCGWKPSWL